MRPKQRWTVHRVASLGGIALALAAPAAILAEVPHEFRSGQKIVAEEVNTNFSNLDKRLGVVESKSGATLVVARSAERTGAVPSGTTGWITIPGLTVEITIGASSLVQMTANGVQRTANTALAECLVSYRFVVDGIAKGDPMHGQRIHVTDKASTEHSTWTVADFHTLGAGRHTIAVQASHYPGNNCHVCAEHDGSLVPYDSCTLNVIAVAQ